MAFNDTFQLLQELARDFLRIFLIFGGKVKNVFVVMGRKREVVFELIHEVIAKRCLQGVIAVVEGRVFDIIDIALGHCRSTIDGTVDGHFRDNCCFCFTKAVQKGWIDLTQSSWTKLL